MKILKVAGWAIGGLLVSSHQAFAGSVNGGVVPEIDGTGAIIAIGLVVGLVALIRERFHK